MPLFSKKTPAEQEKTEQHYRDLRRTMQDIVIAHAAVCYRHMTTEQFQQVQAEWARIVKGKGWAPFFADAATPLPGPRITTSGVSAQPTNETQPR